MRNKSLLEKIIANKKREVEMKKRKTGGFAESILNPIKGDIAIIAEIKLRSPSAGVLGKKDQVLKIARNYQSAYADAISVVTDGKYFGGNLEFIKKIKKMIDLPILAKDFIIDPIQIYVIKKAGADAILLISRIVSGMNLIKFVKLALDFQLDPVVEVDNERELTKALKTKATFIAVNARNLSDFSVDIKRACRILKMIPKGKIPLAFSGVKTSEDIKTYKSAGAKAVLVGTSLMRAYDKKSFIRYLKSV